MSDFNSGNISGGNPSGGSTGSPAGPSPAGSPNPSGPGQPSLDRSTAAPGGSTVDLTDDTLVRWPGEANPIRYADLHKRLQADHTRKTQAAAKLQKSLEAERTKFQTESTAERRRLESMAAQLAGRGQPTGHPEWAKTLAAKEYISGQDMAQMMMAIQNDGFGGVGKALEQRDQAFALLYQRVLKAEAVLNRLSGASSQTEHEGRIRQAIQALDRDPEDYIDTAKAIYAGYEGDDLESEFPEILRNHIERVEKAAEKRRSRNVGNARNRFPIPGRGGNGQPGRNLMLSGKENSKETTDKLWELIQGDTDKT